MKILHVVQAYTPAIGGTEWLIQNLSERLIERYGDEVTVFTTNAAKNCEMFWSPTEPQLPAGWETINGVRVRRFPVVNRLPRLRHLLSKVADRLNLPFNDWLRAFYNGPLIPTMTAEIARFPAEVIAASSFPLLHMHYALKGGQWSQRPVVLHGALHIHDRWGFDRPMIYQAIRQAQAYIANSTFERDYLIARQISPQKIQPIGVGVDLARFAHADRLTLRQLLGWGAAPVVAFVGQLSPRKGVDQLIAAMPHVWQRYPAARLLLAGTRSAATPHIEEMVAKRLIDDPQRIILKPDFLEAEKASIFAACDMLVFPSQYESFGLVLLEAWASQKPVITLNRGPMPTIVTHGIDGLLVEPDQPLALAAAICQMLEQPALGERLGQAGYHKVKRHYTWEIIVDKFRAVYQQVMAANGAL